MACDDEDPFSPLERSLRAKAAAYARFGHQDPVEATEKARRTFLSRFEQQADPEAVLDPTERQRRAQALLTAHMHTLAAKSAKARRARKGQPKTTGRQVADVLADLVERLLAENEAAG